MNTISDLISGLVAAKPSSTADLLAKVGAELETVESVTEALAAEREAIIEGDGEIAAVLVVDGRIENQRRLRIALSERSAFLEGRAAAELISRRVSRREQYRTAARAIVEIAAAEYAALTPPIRLGRYIETAADGAVHLIKELFRHSGQRVADERAGLEFIERCARQTPYWGVNVDARFKALVEFVGNADLDLLYGAADDFEAEEAA